MSNQVRSHHVPTEQTHTLDLLSRRRSLLPRRLHGLQPRFLLQLRRYERDKDLTRHLIHVALPQRPARVKETADCDSLIDCCQ